jgi:hypothetical protein
VPLAAPYQLRTTLHDKTRQFPGRLVHVYSKRGSPKAEPAARRRLVAISQVCRVTRRPQRDGGPGHARGEGTFGVSYAEGTNWATQIEDAATLPLEGIPDGGSRSASSLSRMNVARSTIASKRIAIPVDVVRGVGRVDAQHAAIPVSARGRQRW